MLANFYMSVLYTCLALTSSPLRARSKQTAVHVVCAMLFLEQINDLATIAASSQALVAWAELSTRSMICSVVQWRQAASAMATQALEASPRRVWFTRGHSRREAKRKFFGGGGRRGKSLSFQE
jgi:hypothetical protein